MADEVEIEPSTRLKVGDRFQARIYYKPSYFGSYDEDRRRVVKEFYRQQADPESIFHQTRLREAFNVIQPAPSEKRQEPYIAFDLEVVKNPPILLAGGFLAAFSAIVTAVLPWLVAVVGIVLVWKVLSIGAKVFSPTGVLVVGLIVAGVFFWKGGRKALLSA